MKINKLSDNFTPVNEGIFFGIDTEEESATDLVVEILELSTEEVVATQLLRNVCSATVNIAPYVEHFAELTPSPHRQITFSEAPSAAYKIRVGDIESEEVIVSVNRSKIGSSPALLTSFPLTRRIAHGEIDEVLILTNKGKMVYAEVEADDGEILDFAYLSTTGATILTISPEEFDEATKSFEVTLYCEGEILGTLRYIIALPTKNTTRLAWLSESGAIERYTFPTSHKTTLTAKKRSFMTGAGLCTTHSRAKQLISLSSRFESRATIEALAQIVASPMVWVENGGCYELVEVTTSEIDYNLFDEPSHIHFNVCLTKKEVALW